MSSGWRGVMSNSLPKIGSVAGNNDNLGSNQSSGEGSKIFFAQVERILHGNDFNKGAIRINSIDNGGREAFPLFPNIINYPVEGEMVLIIDAEEIKNSSLQNSKPSYMKNTGGLFYISSLNIWNNPGFNGTSYPEASFFPIDKSQKTTPLASNPGGFILQGRFGNSVRLGSTNSNFINTWSEVGDNGDPIVIISNGQSSDYNQPTENIKENLSSIYLTSYQKIANFSLTNENFNSYKKTPETPAEYKQPQIILNSSRVILNANNVNDTKNDNLNTGDILISGEKSIGLSSNESINIESKETIIDGKVLLGSKDAKESALLGDTTQELLIQLTTEVRNLSLALQTVPFAVGGVASLSTPILENILSNMSKIKSNTVKLK